jgi:hypothetical protein
MGTGNWAGRRWKLNRGPPSPKVFVTPNSVSQSRQITRQRENALGLFRIKPDRMAQGRGAKMPKA